MQAAVEPLRDERLERVERYSRPAELFVSVLLVAALVAPFVIDLSAGSTAGLDQAAWFLWALLAADYVFRLMIARSKGAFLRANVLDLAVVVLPMLSLVFPEAQLFAALRAVRVIVLIFDISKNLQSVLRSRNMPHAVGIVMLVIFVCGALEYGFEHRAPDAKIHSLGDGLWWAVTTFTTVGYGDLYPVTPAGRGTAVFLMLVGLTFGGILAAALVSLFMRNDASERDEVHVVRRVAALERKIDRVLELLDQDTSALRAPQVRRE